MTKTPLPKHASNLDDLRFYLAVLVALGALGGLLYLIHLG